MFCSYNSQSKTARTAACMVDGECALLVPDHQDWVHFITLHKCLSYQR